MIEKVDILTAVYVNKLTSGFHSASTPSLHPLKLRIGEPEIMIKFREMPN